MPVSCWQPGDRGGGLGDLGRRSLVGLAGRADHAVGEVVLEQAETDGVQRLGHRADLGEDVDAVDVFGDHALDAADLASIRRNRVR